MADLFKTKSFSASSGCLQGGSNHAGATTRLACFMLSLIILLGPNAHPARAAEKPEEAKLLFLVARRSIMDPMFERTVVLMLPLKDEPLVVGIIINKPSRVPLLQIFPDSPALQNRHDTAFIGGPVDMAAPALVFHSSKHSKPSMRLYGDVYLTFDADFITKFMQDPKQTGERRLFMGRAQWAPEQLQGEGQRGSWYSLRAEGEVIFDRDSEHLWERLHRRALPPLNVENRGITRVLYQVD